MEVYIIYLESTEQGESFYDMGDAIAPLFGEKSVELCGDLAKIT
jgi:hypothetical protein